VNQPDIDPSQYWCVTPDSRISAYESQWTGYLDTFREFAAAGAPLSEFLRFFDWDIGAYRGVIDPALTAFTGPVDLGRFALLPAPLRLAVERGKYVAVVPEARPGFDLLLPALDHGIGLGVDCVAELGSGVGTNLARLRLRHPGRDLAYIACEPTEAGRAAAATMFARDPAMRFEVRPFDYAHADFGFLEAFARPMVFTSHSIEQVAILGADFYARLLASNVAVCVHMEPVGWQRFTNLFDVVHAMLRDRPTFDRILEGYPWTIDDARLSENAAMWSARHCYNVDLLRRVAEAGERGEIELFVLAYDIAGLNPFNPSTLIGWTRRR